MSDSSPSCSHRDVMMEQAAVYWKNCGGPFTSVRRVICRQVFSRSGTFEAEDALRWAREEDGLISLSTVYRTLHDLEKAGLIHLIDRVDGRAVYEVAEPNNNATSHVHCRDCGQVIPVENPCLSVREGPVVQDQGFSPSKISLRYEASCDQFSQTGKCDRQKKEGN